jgi:hypothetical protein
MKYPKYSVAYLIGWIEGEMEGLPSDMESDRRDRIIEIHQAIIAKLKAEERLWELVEINALNLLDDGYDNIVEAIKEEGAPK